MRRSDQAAAIESAAESLIAVLDPARGDHVLPVSPTQLRVLRWLRANPTTNVNGLAEALGVGASSASRLCDRLEALGYLRRNNDPRDRREVRLIVTTAAGTLLDELSDRRRQALERVLAAMPAAVRQDLVRSLAGFEVAAATIGLTAQARPPTGRVAAPGRQRTA